MNPVVENWIIQYPSRLFNCLYALKHANHTVINQTPNSHVTLHTDTTNAIPVTGQSSTR